MQQGRRPSGGNSSATTPSKQLLPVIPSSSSASPAQPTPATNNGMLTPSKRSASVGALPPITDLTSPKGDEVRIPKFRGFIGGSSFITKAGYKGIRIDSLWSQHIFESFLTDDEELASVALGSSLADLTQVVIAGEFGAPFSIGDYGFYANSQFDSQSKLLCDIERLNSQQDYYLSAEEWDKIDDYLSQIGSFGSAYFPTVSCGDTFGVLAVKKNAFKVAVVFLDAGLDPLLENEEGEDLFHATKRQYQVLSVRLRLLIERQDQFLVSTQIRADWVSITTEEQLLLSAWRNKVTFLQKLIANLTHRLELIAADLVLKRRCDLLNEKVSADKLWNIAQQEKCQAHIQHCGDLARYVERRLATCTAAAKKFDEETIRFTLDPTLGTKASKSNSAAVSVAGTSRRSSHAKLLLERSQSSKSLPAISEGDVEVKEEDQQQLQQAVVVRDVVSPKTMQERVCLDDVKKRGGQANDAPILGILKNTEDTLVFYK